MLIEQIIREARKEFYDGPPLESGGTSIPGNAAPPIRDLLKAGAFQGKILDYGAGKYGRNANFLREAKLKVYAYDLFNGKDGVDGWEEVSKKLPPKRMKFNVAFSSYVLNVVPKYIQDEIVGDAAARSKEQYHIVRNQDITAMVRKQLVKGTPITMRFVEEHFADKKDMKRILAAQETGSWQDIDDIVTALCRFGVQTTSGFQRIPYLEDDGLTLIRKTSNFKVYKG